MNTTISFRRDEGLALAAAIYALQKAEVCSTPVLATINTFTEGLRSHLAAVFVDGSTVEVMLLHWSGWVRIFAPDWATILQFRQGGLVIQGPVTTRPVIVLETLHVIPLSGLHWTEIPEHLRRDAPAALRSRMMF